MPFDGSGNFTRSYNFVQDKTNGIKIVASRMDGEFDNFATAMNQAFLRNGLVPMTGSLNMGTNTINSIGDGTVGTPAIRFNSDPTTGIYVPGYGKVALTAGGTKRLEANSTGILVSGTATADTFASASTGGVGLQLGTNSAIRDVTAGASTMFFDVSTGGATHGAFNFRSSNALTSRMYIAGTGHVGIGGVPDVRFQVVHDQAANSYFDYYNQTAGGGIVWRQIHRDIANTGNTTVDMAWAGNAFAINNNDTHTSNATVFGVGGSERMRISSVGRIGVGQNNPSQLLDLFATGADDGILVTNSSSSGGRIRLNSTGAGGRNWHINSTANGSGSGGGNFIVRDSTAGDVARLLIDSSGRVALGGSPIAGYQLTVGGSMVLISGGSTFNVDLDGASGANGVNIAASFAAGGYGPLKFTTAATERMRIDASGNVGIGLAPGVKFDTLGRGRFVQDAAPTTGALVLRASSGDTWPAYIQWVNNANSLERGFITIDNSSNFTLSAPGPNSVFNIGGVASTHTFAYNESGGEIQLIDSTGNGPLLMDNASGSARVLKVGSGNMAVGTTGAGALALQQAGVTRLNFNSGGGVSSEDRADAVGYKGLPQNPQSGAYSFALADIGKHVINNGTTATWTIPANASVAFPIGSAITLVNNGSGAVTVNTTTDTLKLAGAGTTGSRTIAANGMATILKVAATTWFISGTGVS